MPALSNGNTCWGNRKAFNFRPEYISDSFLFELGDVNEDLSSVSNSRQNFISSNAYYGYHRIPDPPLNESMSVDDFESSGFDCPVGNAVSRKRPNTQEDNDIVKRLRHQDIVVGAYCYSECDILKCDIPDFIYGEIET